MLDAAAPLRRDVPYNEIYNLVSKYPAPSPTTQAPTIISNGHFSNVYKYPSLVSSLLLLDDRLPFFFSPRLFPFALILLLGCTGAQSFCAVINKLLWLEPPPSFCRPESRLARLAEVSPFCEVERRSSVDGDGSGAERALANT
jgi:hypothetical protein